MWPRAELGPIDPAAEVPEEAVDRDRLLTNATLYWLTATAGSSANLYYEGARAWGAAQEPSPVPTGVAVFPGDPAARRAAERANNIVRWSEFDRGSHFAAMEAPDLLIAAVREFFRRLRCRDPRCHQPDQHHASPGRPSGHVMRRW
jgi:epoxide hydrolase